MPLPPLPPTSSRAGSASAPNASAPSPSTTAAPTPASSTSSPRWRRSGTGAGGRSTADCCRPDCIDIAELELPCRRVAHRRHHPHPGPPADGGARAGRLRHRRPTAAGPDLQARLALRLRRQEVLDRDRPALYEAVIHEAALRMQFGGPEGGPGSSWSTSSHARSGTPSPCASSPSPPAASPARGSRSPMAARA